MLYMRHRHASRPVVIDCRALFWVRFLGCLYPMLTNTQHLHLSRYHVVIIHCVLEPNCRFLLIMERNHKDVRLSLPMHIHKVAIRALSPGHALDLGASCYERRLVG